MILKAPLTFQEQVLRLQNKGMIIRNTGFAEEFLRKNNYYRLNVYFHEFLDDTDHFVNATTFENIVDIYENDRWLRNKLLAVLEPIEILIKTSIAYYLGLNYGSDCFYRNEIHPNSGQFAKVKQSLKNELDRQFNKQNPVIIHHQQKYNGQFPIWVIVEFLSFGVVSIYYSSLSTADRTKIAAQAFGIDENFLQNWLHALGVLRNICAHFGHLYKRGLLVAPRLYKEWNLNQKSAQSLFALCLVIKELSERQELMQFISELSARSENNPTFLLPDYGFPGNWKDLI